jgi:hypothetical protein
VLIVHNERSETFVLSLSILSRLSFSISCSLVSLLSLSLFLSLSDSLRVCFSLFIFVSYWLVSLPLTHLSHFPRTGIVRPPTGILSKSHYDSFQLTTPLFYISPPALV